MVEAILPDIYKADPSLAKQQFGSEAQYDIG